MHFLQKQLRKVQTDNDQPQTNKVTVITCVLNLLMGGPPHHLIVWCTELARPASKSASTITNISAAIVATGIKCGDIGRRERAHSTVYWGSCDKHILI